MATVTKVRYWEEGDRGGKTIASVLHCTVALSGEGAEAADMPASSFIMSSLYSVEVIRFVTAGSVDTKAVDAFTDGSSVYTTDLTQATDANRGLAADVTGTLHIIVKGKP